MVWFLVAIIGAVCLIALLHGVKVVGQQRIQDGLVTSEVILPPGTSLDQSELMLRSLAGLNIPVRQMGDAFGRRTLVLEKLALHGSMHHLLSYPPDFEGIIKSHIAAMVPGVMFNEFDAYRNNGITGGSYTGPLPTTGQPTKS